MPSSPLSSCLQPAASQRIERLVALARLDAAVRYFNPAVATRTSTWDSLFAANVVRIADAPNGSEYGRLVAAMMADNQLINSYAWLQSGALRATFREKPLHDEPPVSSSPQRALVYNGFPSPTMQTSGGYGLVVARGWIGRNVSGRDG